MQRSYTRYLLERYKTDFKVYTQTERVYQTRKTVGVYINCTSVHHRLYECTQTTRTYTTDGTSVHDGF
jgi:hypothetical protein